jgi:BolA family transcriptional regulator, general stress-responsive regulator
VKTDVNAVQPGSGASAAGEARRAQLRSALERALEPSVLEIIDDSARHAGHAGARGGGHFRVTIVSAAFRGRSPIERHRLVYEAVAPLLVDAVHALNIVARTPEEDR